VITGAGIALSNDVGTAKHTLVLRHVPDGLCRRLKAVATAIATAQHRAPSGRWQEQRVWTLPVLHQRCVGGESSSGDRFSEGTPQ
jgi:hypothetical protein